MSDLDALTKRVEQLETLMRHVYSEVQALRGGVERKSSASGGVGERAASAAAAVPVESRERPPQAPPRSTPGAPETQLGVLRTGASAAASIAASIAASTGAGSMGGGASTGAGTAPSSLAPGTSVPRWDDPRATPAGPGTGPSRVASAGSSLDSGGASIESLVGRYGTLALATVTILLGVGAFVSWAIEHRLLGPEVRVVLGLVAAAGVGGVGWWFRSHRSARFGNVLLALALAIVHVDAWGAGPELHLVSPGVALAGAAAASAALAWLARREGEQTLFAVGVGGALIAPFVTSTGESHLLALLLFGYLVITLTMVAVRDRGWDLPVVLLAAGVAAYTGLGSAAVSRYTEELYVPASFALACAVAALALMPARYRSWLAQTALVSLWGALWVVTAKGGSVPRVTFGGAAGTIAAYVTVLRLGRSSIRTFIGSGLLPTLFLLTVLWALPRPDSLRGAVHALVWGVGAAVAAGVYARLRSSGVGAADAADEASSLVGGASVAAAFAGFAGSLSIVLAFGLGHSAPCVVALSAYALALVLLAAETGVSSLLAPAFLTLTGAALVSQDLLGARRSYAYRPFSTDASGAAAAVVAGWAGAVAAARRVATTSKAGGTDPSGMRAAALIPVALLFWWIRMELAGAVSPQVSTFLLILYYAVAGVIAVFVGRGVKSSPLRNAGLAIAVYAALKTVRESWSLNIGLRVGSDLLAGLFMLIVAYSYGRRTGGD